MQKNQEFIDDINRSVWVMNKPDGKKIDLNIEDFGSEEQSSRIIINEDDLLADDIPPKAYPGLQSQPIIQQDQKPLAIRSSSLVQLAFAGLAGGVLAWGITEFLFENDAWIYQSYTQILIEASYFGAVIGSVIGAALGSVEGLSGRVGSKAISGMLISLFVGLVGGALGGFTGQFVYGWLGGGQLDNISTQILVRGFSWSLIGLFIGFGQGLGTGGGRKIVNGLLGGFIGGAVGGLLFDFIAMIFYGGVVSRAIAISLLGLSTGLLIGVVQEIRKQAWVQAVEGPTAGKEYIINTGKTRIGSSPKNDIVLIKDDQVAEQHATIELENNSYFITKYNYASDMFINNHKVNKHQLKNGDLIGIGEYLLRYCDKKVGER